MPNESQAVEVEFEEWLEKQDGPIIEAYRSGELYGAILKILEPVKVLVDLLKAKVSDMENDFSELDDYLTEKDKWHRRLDFKRGEEILKRYCPNLEKGEVGHVVMALFMGGRFYEALFEKDNKNSEFKKNQVNKEVCNEDRTIRPDFNGSQRPEPRDTTSTSA